MGFIGVQGDDIAVDKQRSEGFVQALQHHGFELAFHARGDFTIDSGYSLAKQHLTKNPKLDGLFCATDRIAIGAMRAIQELGLTPGKDVLVPLVWEVRIWLQVWLLEKLGLKFRLQLNLN